MSGVNTFPHFVELIRLYGLLNMALLMIFNYYNPSILLFAVGTTLEIIYELFMFILLAMKEHFEVGNILTLLALSTFFVFVISHIGDTQSTGELIVNILT